jgi:glycosyltransferase involved in cell wall biosynthesis
VLLVSTIEVRKNHALVYQAWRRLLQRHGPAVVPKLVFAGSVGWMSGDLIAQLENDPSTRGHISIISGTSDGDLAWLYRHCLFTLYPSLYEGWGLPVAEGLAFGKACLASDTSAVPEIAGDMVDYHDPHDLVGYVSLLERLIFDPDYRAERERRVRERFRRTHWTDTVLQMTAAADVLFGTVDPELEERAAEAIEAEASTTAFVDPALKRPA